MSRLDSFDALTAVMLAIAVAFMLAQRIGLAGLFLIFTALVAIIGYLRNPNT